MSRLASALSRCSSSSAAVAAAAAAAALAPAAEDDGAEAVLEVLEAFFFGAAFSITKSFLRFPGQASQSTPLLHSRGI
eukprot:8068068-Pyramimonas_sp.AAC.1